MHKGSPENARPHGRSGRIVSLCVAPPFDFSLGVVVPEVRIIGSRCGPFRPALERIEKRALNLQGMIEGEYALADWRAAFDAAARPGALKVLLRM